MSRLLPFLFFLLPFSGIAQTHINQGKQALKKELENTYKKNKQATVTAGTDIRVVIKAPAADPATYIYTFDKAGKCQSEQVVAGCKDCIAKLLTNVIGQQKYGWKKINENQYVSSFEAKLMIELPGDEKDYSFTILRTEWTRELYDLLMNNR